MFPHRFFAQLLRRRLIGRWGVPRTKIRPGFGNGICCESFGLLAVAASAVLVGCESDRGIDYGMNSANVAQHLEHDENFPFVGFWKANPGDDIGLVIKKGPGGTYTVWSCSPRGAIEVESLSPTTLVDDENFNIVNDDTIEVLDKTGGEFTTYVRFQ